MRLACVMWRWKKAGELAIQHQQRYWPGQQRCARPDRQSISTGWYPRRATVERVLHDLRQTLCPVAAGTSVSLTPEEREIAILIARKRYQFARSSGITNARIGSQSNEQTDINGFAAEMAFCKLHNLYPDFSVHYVSARNGTDTGDCRLPDGRTVDVKTTTYKSGKLLIAGWKQRTVAMYALMIGSIDVGFRYCGAIASSAVLTPLFRQSFNGRTSYVATQSQLTNIERYDKGTADDPRVASAGHKAQGTDSRDEAEAHRYMGDR